MLFEELTGKVIDAAMRVHTNLGTGLFEEVYKVSLRHELSKNGVKTLTEVALPVIYDGVELEAIESICLLKTCSS